MTECLASTLGGFAILADTSPTVSQGTTTSGVAVYAGFWGVDRSGRNPYYTTIQAPHRLIAISSWNDVKSVPLQQLATIVDSA